MFDYLTTQSFESIQDLISYLCDAQIGGAYALYPGGPADLLATAYSFKALNMCIGYAQPNEKSAGAIKATDYYLASIQNPDGGFGEQGSTAYETALVLNAVSGLLSTSVDIQAAALFLISHRLTDGSIAGDVATTALFVGAVKSNLRFGEPAISLEADELPEGSTLKAHVRVENRGMVPGSCYVPCRTDWGGYAFAEFADVAPGGESEAVCEISTLGQQGHHVITAEVSSNSFFSELSYKAIANFFVTAGCNLAVSAGDITIDPPTADCSQLITLGATVKNTSTSDAQNVTVAIYDGYDWQQPEKLGEATIPYVDAGSSEAVSINTSLSAGGHSIRAVLDEANAIPELSEDDNQAAKYVTIADAVSIPVPIEPEDNAILGAGNPVFSWRASTGMEYIFYNLECSRTPDFAGSIHCYISSTEQPQDPVVLSFPKRPADGVWYWRVRAYDGFKYTDALETRMLTLDGTAPAIAGLQATPEYISPNGDNVQDEMVIGFDLSEAATVDIAVLDAEGNVVRVLEESANLVAGSYSYTWDGTGDDGQVCEGAFRVAIDAADVLGNSATTQSPVIAVDLTVPQIPDFALSQEALSPNADGCFDSVEVFYGTSEAGTASLALLDEGGERLGEVMAATAVAVGLLPS